MTKPLPQAKIAESRVICKFNFYSAKRKPVCLYDSVPPCLYHLTHWAAVCCVREGLFFLPGFGLGNLLGYNCVFYIHMQLVQFLEAVNLI